jgi:hypothetical protein
MSKEKLQRPMALGSQSSMELKMKRLLMQVFCLLEQRLAPKKVLQRSKQQSGAAVGNVTARLREPAFFALRQALIANYEAQWEQQAVLSG